MINKVILVGDVWKDPEERTTKKEGLSMCILSVVTKEFIKNNNDKSNNNSSEKSYTEKKEWHTIVTFGDTANYILEKIKKADIVYIEGQLQTRELIDGENKKTYIREIIINRSGIVKKLFSKQRERTELINSIDEDIFSSNNHITDEKKKSFNKKDINIEDDETLDSDNMTDDEDLLF